eukprot:Skav231204  [mRNA]  locus=scaffold2432:93428:94079:- [translate_table: standard]
MLAVGCQHSTNLFHFTFGNRLQHKGPVAGRAQQRRAALGSHLQTPNVGLQKFRQERLAVQASQTTEVAEGSGRDDRQSGI